MTRQNRVQPDGQIVTDPGRGMFWGNRGCLHDDDGNLVRYSAGRPWLTCVLEYKGIRRTLNSPGRFTELFFLDEATALSAGHRPCALCRRPAYRAFTAAWADAHGVERALAPEIDARMHADRLAGRATKRTHEARLADLPDGTMIERAGRPWLVHDGDLLAWAFGGYRERRPKGRLDPVTVLTPACTVATLAAGYRPELHPSALR